MKEEVNDRVHVKDKWLEAGESKWIYPKEKNPDRFHYKFFPHCSPPWTPASHEWTTKPRAGRQPDLRAGPPLAGRARPTGAGPCAVDGCQQRSELGLPSPAQAGPPEGLQSQPHRERRALRAAQLLISLCFMFLASVFLVLLPAGQTVCTVKKQLPAEALKFTSCRQGCWGRASEGVRLGETLATSSWLPSRAFQLFLYVLLVLCLFGI